MVKEILKFMGVFMAPMTLIFMTALLVSWGSIVIYSKVFEEDKSDIEKSLETIVEGNIEDALNLPDGTLDGKLDFMVVPLEEDKKD